MLARRAGEQSSELPSTPLELLVTAVLVLVLLLASAFFSGSETALTAASRARMCLPSNRRETSPGEELVNSCCAKPNTSSVGHCWVTIVVNILASALATGLPVVGAFGEFGVLYATAIMTVLIVIFAEVLPKTYAIAYPDRIALSVAPVMRVVMPFCGHSRPLCSSLSPAF